MSQGTDAVVISTIGIDTGKNTLHLVGLDDQGTIVLRERLARSRIRTRLANVPRCLIGIEAGMGTHYVARELIALGHDVRQAPPVYARPFRQTHKNDFRDAYAIAEAVQRPSTRCVPVKTDDQLDLQALHRVRSRLISARTAVINQIRGFLLERGIPVRQGIRFLRQQLPEILAKRNDVLSPRIIRIIEDLSGDWRHLDERIEHVAEEIEVLACCLSNVHGEAATPSSKRSLKPRLLLDQAITSRSGETSLAQPRVLGWNTVLRADRPTCVGLDLFPQCSHKGISRTKYFSMSDVWRVWLIES
jgi:hypothetical protein